MLEIVRTSIATESGPDTYRHEGAVPDTYSHEGAGSDTLTRVEDFPDTYRHEEAGRTRAATWEQIRAPTTSRRPATTYSYV